MIGNQYNNAVDNKQEQSQGNDCNRQRKNNQDRFDNCIKKRENYGYNKCRIWRRNHYSWQDISYHHDGYGADNDSNEHVHVDSD